MSTMYLPSNPTVLDIKKRFPYAGQYHFRLKLRGSDSQAVFWWWLDLPSNDDAALLPIDHEQKKIELKVLQLSAEDSDSDSMIVEKAQDDRLIRDCGSHYYHSSPGSQKSSSRTFVESASATGTKMVTKALKKGLKTFNKYLKSTTFQQDDGGQAAAASALPSPTAAAQLSKILILFSTPVTKQQHERKLKRLWALCFEQHQLDQFEMVSPMWQSSAVGFQSPDPLSDLRGLLSLECLLYYMSRQDHNRQELTYPFAAVGVNLTLVCVDVLNLQQHERPEPYWRLFEDPDGFYEAYCLTFRAFDRFWTEEHGTDADFPRILERTKRFLYNLVTNPAHRIDSVESLLRVSSRAWH